jgi:drug/metabolite transporter (DMT)-like permease
MNQHSWRLRRHVRPLIWVLPCVAAWSLIPTLATHTGSLDAFGFLFWSNLVSALCLLLCTRLTGHWPTLRAYSTTDLRRLAALAALAAFAGHALLYSAYAPCGDGACRQNRAIVLVTQYTWPAGTMLWSALLLRDTLTCRTLLSWLLAIAAVAAAANGNSAEADAVSKLPLVVLAAMIFGLYSTLLKRIAYEPFSSMAVGFTVATFLSLLAIVEFSTRPPVPDGPAAVSVLINGVFVNALSYVCWSRALQAAPIRFVAPWVALTPFLAAVFAGPSIGLEPRHWIGIALVTGSALLATITSTHSATEPLPRSPRRFDLVEESS